MRRLIPGLFALMMVSSCAPIDLGEMQRNATLAVQQQVHRMLAAQFTRRFSSGIDHVIASLQQTGGFLDNPLVRILLPPPLGLVLGIVTDVSENPDAAWVELLMNRAAEAAIPGAGPILKAALTTLSVAELETVLAGGRQAATELLEDRARTAVHDALAPVVTRTLTDAGAEAVYDRLLQAYEIKRVLETGTITDEPARDLGAYVTETAVDGLFARLAEEERRVRDEIDSLRAQLGIQP
jgi:hypothetical protein